MRSILIESVTIKNFRSFRDETISFPQSQGLRYLTGENRVEPQLGTNGAGKSTVFDAVNWCFYGTSVRGTRTSELISWGGEQTQVVAKIIVNAGQVNEEQHRINRFGPPGRLELDGRLVEQSAVDTLLGLSRLRFLHSVIFGQGQHLFPDLDMSDRSALLDEILDLKIWQRAAEAAGTKCTALEKEVASKKVTVAEINGIISGLPTDEQFVADINNWERERQQRLAYLQGTSITWNQQQTLLIEDLKRQEAEWKEKLLTQIEDKAKQLDDISADLAPLLFKVENAVTNPFAAQENVLSNTLASVIETKEKASKSMHQYTYELSATESAEKLWENDTCPLCKTQITTQKKQHELACTTKVKAELQQKLNQAQAEYKSAYEQEEGFRKELASIRETAARNQQDIAGTRREISILQSKIKGVESEARSLLEELDSDKNPYSDQLKNLQERVNPYTAQSEELASQVNPFIKKRDETGQRRASINVQLAFELNQLKQIESRLMAAEYWKHGFKRIRLYFVQQVLAALEIEIQSALSSLGMPNWQIKLATETLTKSDTVRLGVQIRVKSLVAEGKWEVWSGGETQRLRLAMAMGVASLILRAAGVAFNLEAWDEQTHYLGNSGVEDMLEALRYRAEALKKPIWIIDHSNLQFSGFTEIWTVIKDQSGSKISRLEAEA